MDNRTYETTSGPVVSSYTQSVWVTGISWGAILAGVFVALSVASILNLLGLGLDLIALGNSKNPHTITLLSTLWIVLSSIFAMLAGGWVAGRMCGPQLATEGALHGIVMCGVSIFLTFLLASSVGSMLGVMSTIVAHNVVVVEHHQNNDMNMAATPDNQNMNQLQQNRQDNVMHAKEASKGLGLVVLLFFVSFLLSAIAAAFGGMWGAASGKKLLLRKS
ncbi:MAG: hypothetical protein WC748_02620 [Legionellales bacterium]|jgi:hypothetical protein